MSLRDSDPGLQLLLNVILNRQAPRFGFRYDSFLNFRL